VKFPNNGGYDPAQRNQTKEKNMKLLSEVKKVTKFRVELDPEEMQFIEAVLNNNGPHMISCPGGMLDSTEMWRNFRDVMDAAGVRRCTCLNSVGEVRHTHQSIQALR
jgi:hypothetical protein